VPRENALPSTDELPPFVPRIRPKGADDPADGISLDAYYRTDYWKIISRAAKIALGCKCFRCKKLTETPHCHHRHYDSLGAEDILRDLEILCPGCHASHHRGYKRP
jgi:hypothetical protein